MPGRAVFGGSGLVLLLIAGGLVVNSSIYNGASLVLWLWMDAMLKWLVDRSGLVVLQWTVVTVPSSIRGKYALMSRIQVASDSKDGVI